MNFPLNFRKFKVAKVAFSHAHQRWFFAGHAVAIVTYYVTKMIATCPPMVRQYFDSMIIALSDK